MKCIAIIVCGGAGTRMGAGENKLFLTLCGKTILQRTLEPFADTVDGIVLVHRPEDLEKIRNILASAELPFPVTYAVGGSTRQQSVYNGLQALPEDADTVLIHDGARCLVSRDLILAIRAQTEEKDSAIPAVPVTDTLKKAGSDLIIADTVDRTGLFRVQTPQGFRTGLIREAHELARSSGFEGTDDASIMEFAGHPVFLIPGENANMKMTVKEDLQMAEALLNQRRVPDLRVGQGYDVHKLVEGRDLILCGVTVPHETGLLGHSDADVAVHALMDALLGALALGDIGQHFPDKDPAYAGISSILLLQHVMQLLRRHHASVVNADVTIVAQRPKLAAYIPLMRHNLAEAMQIPESRVSVKATTTEHLGFEGEEKGISSQAICLLQID